MIAPDGSEVVVGQHIDRRWRYCQCRVCGRVDRCTPTNDYYTVEGDGPDAGLLCKSCWHEHCRAKHGGIPA